MTRVTGKFQITLPKRLVDAFGIRVGDEVELVAAGEAIAIVPASAARLRLSPEERLQHFDQATRRQAGRSVPVPAESDEGRGWSRDELYNRGRPG
jgi:AbrB family looped-hinge helix DNA binding protein